MNFIDFFSEDSGWRTSGQRNDLTEILSIKIARAICLKNGQKLRRETKKEIGYI